MVFSDFPYFYIWLLKLKAPSTFLLCLNCCNQYAFYAPLKKKDVSYNMLHQIH